MLTQQTLGDYLLLKQIGQGSLGDVFLAEHRFIKKQFVLKILPEELSQDRNFVQRFEEEVGFLASMEHPHIVKIHNVSFSDGVYFIVSDCVVDSIGETTHLGQYMAGRKERLKEDDLVKVLRQIADALNYAHQKQRPNGQKGVTHGTLKLSNLLIGKNKQGIELLISDFGLSRIIGPHQVVSRSYKALAETLGLMQIDGFKTDGRYLPYPLDTHKVSKLNLSFLQNFAFLAPEQKRIDEQRSLDPKVDIYAFGVLTYYMICGKFPEGFFELPSEIAPEYKKRWDSLIKACLHPKPEKRPSNLLVLMDELAQEKAQPVAFETLKHPQLIQVLENKIQNIEEEIKKEEIKPVIVTPQIKPVPFVEEPAAPFIIPNIHVAKEPVVSHYQQEEKNTHLIEAIPSDMVVIQGGFFNRGNKEGSRDEMPRHRINIPSFAIDIHPVTNDQFVRFLDFMGGEKDANYHDLIRLKDSRIKRTAGKLIIESGYSKHPVVGVTWYGALAYSNWVKKRLPSEAEWEIAAYGGNENALYPSGDTIEKNQANFFSSDTTPVMSYIPNGYGLYDMAGNVYEWCQDWYGYNYYEHSAQEPNNPKGPLQGVYRVLRGGCWKSLKDDLRCAHRHRNNPGTVNGTYGFRCALDV